MEYATEASGDGYGAYVERLRGETEDDYRDRVLGDGRDAVLRALVDQAVTLDGLALTEASS
jgi:hypothetical protein